MKKKTFTLNIALLNLSLFQTIVDKIKVIKVESKEAHWKLDSN